MINLFFRLLSDDKKLEKITQSYALEDQDFEDLIECIKLIKNESKRIKCMIMVKTELYYGAELEILESIKEDKVKIEFLETMDGLDPEDIKWIILSINDEDKRIELLQTIKTLDSMEKSEIISAISSDNKKIELLQTAEGLSSADKARIIGSCNYRTVKKIMTDIDLSSDVWNIYKMNYADIDFVNENKEFFLENAMSNLENIDLAKLTLSRMFKKNNEVVKKLDFRLLEQKYLDTLGEERLNLISCYSNIQSQIINLSDEQLYIFDKCLDVYVEQNETDEWTVLAQELLKHLSEYDLLIESINDKKNISKEDIIDLARIMQGKNWLKISSIDDVREYEKIKKEKCKAIIEDENASLEEIKQAVYQKIFGHDILYAKVMVDKYGEDIENIDDCDMKDYIRVLKIIETVDDIAILREIFEKCDSAELNKVIAERKLKTEYGKKFFENLYAPQERDRQDSTSNIYEAGTDFRMIITSIGAFIDERDINNYKDDWNRPVLSSQHFCASYIRNDMIGTAPINSICYGFLQMKEDALMLSGTEDIASSASSFNSIAGFNEKYFTPNSQIDKTEEYNEMDFRRIQGGVKLQPDYIIVFRKNGKINNMEEAQKASKQWNGMPIVVVDIDKCLDAEKTKVKEMIAEYNQTHSIELAKEIIQKVRNNRQTDRTFCLTLELKLNRLRKRVEDEEINKRNIGKKEGTKETDVSEEELIENNETVSAKERENGVRKIRDIYNKVREAVKEGKDDER